MKSLVLLLLTWQVLLANTDYTLNSIQGYSIDDFKLNAKRADANINFKFLENTLEVRRSIKNKTNSPFVKTYFHLGSDVSVSKIKYKNQFHYPIQDSKSYSISFYVDLLSSEKIIIYANSTYEISIDYIGKNQNIIDNSCFPYQLKIKSTKQINSIGCTVKVDGHFGDQTNTLQVHTRSKFTGINGKASSNSHQIHKPGIVHSDAMKIHAYFPKRHHRLKTAIGFGPYRFDTSFPEDGKQETALRDAAPAFMLYGNLEVDKTNSIRFFNATVTKDAIFNNAGLYYASTLVSLLNDNLTLTSLLGFQHLHFKESSDIRSFSEVILPQGLEFLYTQAFGIKNFLISGGGFVSTTTEVDYENLWIRWGRGYYWELNYIYWADQDISAKMWGLSLIFPSFKLF